jgi:hypothetical protein
MKLNGPWLNAIANGKKFPRVSIAMICHVFVCLSALLIQPGLLGLIGLTPCSWSSRWSYLVAMGATLLMRRCQGEASCQWPFQEPKLEVPTIYKAYIRPM